MYETSRENMNFDPPNSRIILTTRIICKYLHNIRNRVGQTTQFKLYFRFLNVMCTYDKRQSDGKHNSDDEHGRESNHQQSFAAGEFDQEQRDQRHRHVECAHAERGVFSSVGGHPS